MKPRTPPEAAVPVRLDATKLDVESPASVATQIPHADTLIAGSAVVVGAVAVRKRGALGKLIGDAHVKVSRAARCTALVARGYVGVGAEGDEVWGVSPSVSPSPDLRVSSPPCDLGI
jgi:hypothetical protein